MLMRREQSCSIAGMAAACRSGVVVVFTSSSGGVHDAYGIPQSRCRQHGRRLQRVWHCHGFDTAETPELTGHVIWSLFTDPSLMSVSGRALIGAEVADSGRSADVHHEGTICGGKGVGTMVELFSVHTPAVASKESA